MGVNDETLAKTIPWACPKCGQNIDLPLDVVHNGERVECPFCDYHGVLVRSTFPFTCVKCSNIFGARETTRTLGGTVVCPVCHQKYRRAARKIIEDVTQDHGRLVPVKD